NIITATPVTALVIEYIRKIESLRMGFEASLSAIPKVSKYATLPCLAIRQTAPLSLFSAMYRSTQGLIRSSRSLENPTCSGATCLRDWPPGLASVFGDRACTVRRLPSDCASRRIWTAPVRQTASKSDEIAFLILCPPSARYPCSNDSRLEPERPP